MFYTYRQNNSAGWFQIDKRVNIYVIIEADKCDVNDRAEQIGLYFDGCEQNLDCECCGDRWYRCHIGEGTETPTIYDDKIDSFVPVFDRKSHDVVCYFANGAVGYTTYKGDWLE